MRTTALIIGLGLALAACSGSADDAKDLVREELIDGSSARFENVVVDAPSNRVCGWVNAKNRLGAYTGAETFVVEAGEVTQLGSRRDPGSDEAFGSCVALNKAATARMLRDADRALENYEAATKAQ